MPQGRWMPFAAALTAASLALTACGTGSDNAQESGDTPPPPSAGGGAVASCYQAVGIGVPAPAPSRAVFVLVDQTTGLDDRLRGTIQSNAERLLGPGTAFTIATFSAFSRGNYATVLASGTVEAPLTEHQRLNLSSRLVDGLAGCLDQQRAFAAQLLEQKLAEATGAASSSFSNSEIIGSLRQLAKAVKASPAREKIVILVSDLLEHSAATSFYSSRDLRQVDVGEEIRKAEAHNLFADFGGARVAVIGAGLLSPESGAGAVRDTARLNALRSFWEQWFERSNARLIAYGEPDLVTPLAW